MAIQLKDSNLAFFEIVKTGTTFIRDALYACGIEYYEMMPFTYFDPGNNFDHIIANYRYDYLRHSPWWSYKYVNEKYCSIRHPLKWYESMWRFYNNQNLKIRNSYLYLGHIQNIPMEKDFNLFIDRCIDEFPCMFTRIVEQFTGPNLDIVKIIKLENINVELYKIMLNIGYPTKQIQKILEIPKINESPNFIYNWETKQKDKIIKLESKIIERFYNEK